MKLFRVSRTITKTYTVVAASAQEAKSDASMYSNLVSTGKLDRIHRVYHTVTEESGYHVEQTAEEVQP